MWKVQLKICRLIWTPSELFAVSQLQSTTGDLVLQWADCSCYCSGWGEVTLFCSSLYFAVLCFVSKTPVISSLCFVYCWTALAQCQSFLSHPPPKARRLEGMGSHYPYPQIWILGEGSEQRAEWLFSFWPGATQDSSLWLVLLDSELELRTKWEFCQ